MREAGEDAVTGPDVPDLSVRVTPEQRPGVWRVTVHGELDLATAPALACRLSQVLDQAEVLLLDLAGVTFMDASGVSVLLRARTAAVASGRAVLMAAAHPAVVRVLDLLRLTDLLPARPAEGPVHAGLRTGSAGSG